MKKLAALLLMALLAVPLAGCGPEDVPVLTEKQKAVELPRMPVRLVECFNRYGVKMERRKYTAGEIERIMKTDRASIAIMRGCGKDFVAWYEKLRKEWR